MGSLGYRDHKIADRDVALLGYRIRIRRNAVADAALTLPPPKSARSTKTGELALHVQSRSTLTAIVPAPPPAPNEEVDEATVAWHLEDEALDGAATLVAPELARTDRRQRTGEGDEGDPMPAIGTR